MEEGTPKYKTNAVALGAGKFFFLLLVFLLTQSGTGRILVTQGAPAEKLTLIPGKAIDGTLSAGETHAYTFELSHGKFLRIDFYSSRFDLIVTVVWPGGTRSSKWNIAGRTTTPIAFIADLQGVYQLNIQSYEKKEDSGAYRFEIRTLRAAGVQDSKQVDACERLSNATSLRRLWTEASLKSAMGEYEKALRYWKASGDRLQEAGALKSTGDIREILSEWQKALTSYEEAQTIYARLGDRDGQIRILNALSALSINQGRFQKALEIYGPVPRVIEDLWERAHELHNLGAAYWGMNRMPQATESLNKALELRKSLNDRAGQADTLLYLGYVDHALKDVPAAEQCYRQSLDLWRAVENRRGVALALTALGHLYNISGERQRALEFYDQSRQVFQTIGDLSGQYTVLAGMAYMYHGLGENQEALRYYVRALDLSRRSGDMEGESSILNYISAIYIELGDYKNALQYSQKSVQVNRAMPSPLGEAYALGNLGKALDALGKQTEAAERYERALALSREGGDRFLEGLLLNALGQLHYRSGRSQTARKYYSQALSLQKKANDSVRMPQTLFNLARAERDLGNLDGAIQYAAQGLKIAESLRGKVASSELRGSYLASVHEQYEFMIDYLMQLHKQRPNEEFDARALQTSEEARARSLLDSLAEAQIDVRQGADPALLQRERSLQKSLDAEAERQMQLLSRKHSMEEETAVEEEINAITEKYEEVQSLIKSTSPHYAALTQPRPLGLPEIQQSILDDDTLLLEYALGEERSYLWAVTPQTFQSFELPKRSEIESCARRLREVLLARQNRVGETAAEYQKRIREADVEYRKEAASLSRMLLSPVSDQLKSQRLLVVTEGALQYLPFGALPKPGLAGSVDPESPPWEIPLLADHEIVHLPSASLMAVLRQETSHRPVPPKTLAVLADPVFEADDPRIREKKPQTKPAATSVLSSHALPDADLPQAVRETRLSGQGLAVPRLPATREEANSILALVSTGSRLKLFDFSANRAVAMGPELGQYRIVHFATHGILDGEHPERSALVLSLFNEQGQSQYGYLRLHDIYNLKLPVDLVVLSACNTALGKEVRGEGLVGIVRGFMYAGAARVVASLWKVEDEATAALMERFYRRMLQEGQAPARALRLAQLDIRKQKRWQSPFYWAAFVLQGEWK
jgi:CHAT domain-containing protein/Tfp pilus assembly protein PilF